MTIAPDTTDIQTAVSDVADAIHLEGDAAVKLLRAIRAVGVVRATDDTRVALTTVRLDATSVCATDSYRLAACEVETGLSSERLIPGETVAWLTKVVTLAQLRHIDPAGACLEITWTERHVEVVWTNAAAGQRHQVMHDAVRAAYPAWRQVIPGDDQRETSLGEHGSAYNPHYLASMSLVAKQLGGDNTSPAVMLTCGPTTPAIWEIRAAGMTCTYLLMPVRI